MTSTDTDTTDGQEPEQSKDPAQIEAEIAATREELSHTVDELSQKLDVKSQAQHRMTEIKQRAQATAQDPDARAHALRRAAPALGGIAAVALLLGVLRRANS